MTEPLDETMDAALVEIIRRRSGPLTPLPTDTEPRFARLEGIRAVLFDVYGTLFISASGDVGTTDVDSRPQAFEEAFQAVGVDLAGRCPDGVRRLSSTISTHQKHQQERGIKHPEVDIRDVWGDVIQQLASEQLPGDGDLDRETTTQLALEYEVRTNPVWPMPNALETLRAIHSASLTLGIVSNAQVFTKLLFTALLSNSLEELGFDSSLCEWSYEHRQAKPGTFLYERVARKLTDRGVSARNVLFVGNDILKDVWPASQVGFRTALFAGDARSYRPREDDERVRNVQPDLVLTDLAQLPPCVITG